MKWNFLLPLVFCSSVIFNAHGETLEELSLRVKELEQQQNELLNQAIEPKPLMGSFLNDSLTFGGFFEPGYTFIDGKDTDTQAAPSHRLAINLSADFEKNFHFSSQILSSLGLALDNPHNDPRLASDRYPSQREFNTRRIITTLIQGYLEYRKSRAVNVQFGLGYVPFGYAFHEREFILFHRRSGPQMVRNGGEIIPPLWQGVHLHGSIPYGNNSMGYNLYSFTSPAKVNTLGAGGRLWWASQNETIVAGTSVQSAKGEMESYETIGADVKFEKFPWIIRSEFFQTLNRSEDPWSLYVEPAIFAFDEKILFYIFGDFLSDPRNKTNNVLVDKYKRWEYGGGVNWLPSSYIRYRLGLTYNDYIGSQSTINTQDRDFLSLDLSMGVAF